MNIIKGTFSWLTGANNTGVSGTTDILTDQYRGCLPKLLTPAIYTTREVSQEISRASAIKVQAELAKAFHEARRETIKDLDNLDRLTTETAVLYSDKALAISDRRSKAQERILPNEVRTQLNNSRVNAIRSAYSQGLKIDA